MSRVLGILTLIMSAGTVLSAQGIRDRSSEPRTAETRLQALEDREEISQLLIDYGRLLDQRDFAAFSRLFSKDAEYVGGGGAQAVRGPKAIGAFLEDIFRRNPSGLSSSSAHLFANATIEIDGDTATAVSKGLFAARDQDNRPAPIMLATYHDKLVREDGRWKFRRREVVGNIPVAVPEVSK